MDKHTVALVLAEIGSLLRVQGENRFKSKAYETAARAIEKADEDVVALARAGRIEEIAGVGPASARVVRELVEAGESTYLAELRERTPSGIRELLAVPGLGEHKLKQLRAALTIETLDDLEAAAQSGAIAGVRGFGERTQARILEGIAFVRATSDRWRYAPAMQTAERLIGLLREHEGIEQVALSGELRRALETVGGIELVVAASPATCDAVLSAFPGLGGSGRGERSETAATTRLADGLVVRMHCVSSERFATTLLYTTGADAHLRALEARAESLGLELQRDGVRRSGRLLNVVDEADVYRHLELQPIPPELRENGDAVELAAAGALPELVRYDDVQGCFHCHTTWSDGRDTVRAMAEAAAARGWRYLGISDHSRNAGYAGGLSSDEVRRQRTEIDRWNAQHGERVRLFAGIEADILADGTLDYAVDSDLLDGFDFVIGSVHSHFRMGAADMTRRILRALDDPRLTMLGHATGRLLLRREGYGLDLDAVLERAAARDVVVEINGDPHRLDLDWRHWPAARARGVLCAVNPDAHSTQSLDYVRYGIGIARKAGLTAADVVNCWPRAAVESWLNHRREH